MCHVPSFGKYSGTKPVVGSPKWSSTVMFNRSEVTGLKRRDRESKIEHGIASVASSNKWPET